MYLLISITLRYFRISHLKPLIDDTLFHTVSEVPVEMLYIVLSVAGIVLVATVILTFFVCLACYQNKQSSKKARLMKLAAKVCIISYT